MVAQNRNHISKMSRFRVMGQTVMPKKGLNPEYLLKKDYWGLANGTNRSTQHMSASNFFSRVLTR